MAGADDDDHQIGYQALPRGVPVHASGGEEVGTVRRVLDNASTSSTASSSTRRRAGASSTRPRSPASRAAA
jgi:hypothetical protein